MNAKSSYFLILLAALTCLPVTPSAQPVITVDPQQIEIELGAGGGGVGEAVVRIGNDGDEDLFWESNLEIINEPRRQGPRRDDPGDLLAQFRGINAANRFCSPVAWDWENEMMWVATINPNVTAAYTFDPNYENFEEVVRIEPMRCIDGAWANGVFYLPVFSTQTLSRYDARGENIGAIQMPFSIVGAAADDEEDWIFLMNSRNRNIHVYQLEENGDVGDEIGVIDNHIEFHNADPTFGLEWVNRHRDGPLWMTSPTTGEVYQISVDTERWTCTDIVQNFRVFPNDQEAPESGVVHDGHNLWAGGFAADNIRIYDDGNNEPYWIIFNPQEGMIPSGESMDVPLHFDAAGLFGGDYEAEWHILSNDPASPDVSVNIRVRIPGFPDLYVEWPEEAGFPDIIDFNRTGDVWLDHPNTLQIMVRNIGTEDLVIDNIWFDSQHFVADPVQFVLAPNRSQVVNLTYTNDERGVVIDTLRFESDDAELGDPTYTVRAEAFLPPIISVDPEVIEVSLGRGESEDHAVSLSNDGEYLLRWNAQLEIIQEPERDETLVTIEPDSGEIQPNEAQDIIVHFELVELDSLPEVISLMIYSNDPNHEIVEVQLRIYSMSESEAHTPPLPDRLSLSTIYPNPFNSTAWIEYSLPVRTQSMLSLLDLQGRELMRISEGLLEAGTHRLTLEAGQLPAGTYLIRLRAGSEMKLAKAVVVK